MTSTELDPLKKALGAYGAQLNLEKAAYSGKADQYLQQQFAAALKPAQERSRTGETPLAPADAHTTRLDPAGEQLFQEWRKQWAPHDSGEDYDLRGAYKEGLLPGDDGHWSDRYKKPNHPTFSVESVYAQQGNPGHWTGENHDIYVAPKAGPSLQQETNSPLTVQRGNNYVSDVMNNPPPVPFGQTRAAKVIDGALYPLDALAGAMSKFPSPFEAIKDANR